MPSVLIELPDDRPREPADVDRTVYMLVCTGFSAGTLSRQWGMSEQWVRNCCERYCKRGETVTEVDCTARPKHATMHRRHPTGRKLVCLICHPPMPETRKNAE